VANKTNHWKLGLFVVVALAIALAAVVALGLRRLNRDGIPMVTYFDESVQGLDQGSPVKFRGVTIGNVQSITIAPDHLHVEVWMRLYTDELARMGFGPEDKRDPSLRPQLAAAGITGVKFVQFDNFPPERYPEPLLEFAPSSEYYAPSVQSTLKGLEEVVNEVGAKLPHLTDELGDTLFEAKKSLRSIADGLGLRDDREERPHQRDLQAAHRHARERPPKVARHIAVSTRRQRNASNHEYRGADTNLGARVPPEGHGPSPGAGAHQGLDGKRRPTVLDEPLHAGRHPQLESFAGSGAVL